MFNPQYSTRAAFAYRTMVDGLIDGIRAAKADFGTTACSFLIDRQIEPARALEIMDDILAYRPDEIVGIGLDGAERTGPPERFYEVYRRAGAAGLSGRHTFVKTSNIGRGHLRRTSPLAATCSDAIAWTTATTCWLMMGWSPAARDAGLFFNTCPITSVARILPAGIPALRACASSASR